MVIKKCPNCGKEFTRNSNDQKYCSIKCRKIIYKHTRPNYRGSKRISKYNKIYRDKIKATVFYFYSNGTMKCMNPNCEVPGGSKDLRSLNLDHIHDNGSEERKKNSNHGSAFYSWLIKNNFPEGYQVLCANCNTIKNLENCGRKAYYVKI